MSVSIGEQGNNWIFTIPKELINEPFFKLLAERVAYYKLVQDCDSRS